MKNIWPSIVTLALLVLAVALPAAAQDGGGTGTIRGVVEMGDQAVAGARIVLTCTARSDFEGNATTDEIGAFEIPEVPVGDFYVEVYNADDEMIAEGQGTVNQGGDTVEVVITPLE